MTDKQILIDGIDVSGCINYTDELKDCSCRLTYAPFHYRFCEQNPNCYYKQLDQLKQTLAEIKEICNSVENIENINSLYDAKLSGMYLQAHKILQKISKCEVKNDR